MLGVPPIVIWVFGLPVIALYLLIKRRHKLNEPEVKRYYIVLYQGYRHERFFWEFINILRKIILLTINVFLSTQPTVYKGGLAIMLTLTVFRLNVNNDPYTLADNNELERLSIWATGLTLAGGLLFSSDTQGVAGIDIAIFIIIIFLNVKFFLLFFYFMCKEFDNIK